MLKKWLTIIKVNTIIDYLTKNELIQAITDGSRFIYKTTPNGQELKDRLGEFNSLLDHLYAHA